MKYVQVNSTIEPHPDCTLFIYLQDANGAPVPDVRLKMWAGLPAAGEPPYSIGEAVDSNRRTDANGKFQFVVAEHAPVNPLDWYVQVIGDGDVPDSDPVHFPFPTHESRWVIVTLAPAGSLPPGDVKPVAQQEVEPGLEPEAGGKAESYQSTVDHQIPLLSPAPPPPPIPPPLEGPEAIPVRQLPPPLQAPQKLFAHYLLFGSGVLPGTLTNLIIGLDYIIRYMPIVGFSVDEARYAQHVTIVGDTYGVSEGAEQGLRDAGCLVARLTASDSYALEDMFKQLVASGSPYPSSQMQSR